MQIVVETYNNGSPTPEFNNAGQIWNHDFYWQSISPTPSEPSCSPSHVHDLLHAASPAVQNSPAKGSA